MSRLSFVVAASSGWLLADLIMGDTLEEIVSGLGPYTIGIVVSAFLMPDRAP